MFGNKGNEKYLLNENDTEDIFSFRHNEFEVKVDDKDSDKKNPPLNVTVHKVSQNCDEVPLDQVDLDDAMLRDLREPQRDLEELSDVGSLIDFNESKDPHNVVEIKKDILKQKKEEEKQITESYNKKMSFVVNALQYTTSFISNFFEERDKKKQMKKRKRTNQEGQEGNNESEAIIERSEEVKKNKLAIKKKLMARFRFVRWLLLITSLIVIVTISSLYAVQLKKQTVSFDRNTQTQYSYKLGNLVDRIKIYTDANDYINSLGMKPSSLLTSKRNTNIKVWMADIVNQDYVNIMHSEQHLNLIDSEQTQPLRYNVYLDMNNLLNKQEARWAHWHIQSFFVFNKTIETETKTLIAIEDNVLLISYYNDQQTDSVVCEQVQVDMQYKKEIRDFGIQVENNEWVLPENFFFVGDPLIVDVPWWWSDFKSNSEAFQCSGDQFVNVTNHILRYNDEFKQTNFAYYINNYQLAFEELYPKLVSLKWGRNSKFADVAFNYTFNYENTKYRKKSNLYEQYTDSPFDPQPVAAYHFPITVFESCSDWETLLKPVCLHYAKCINNNVLDYFRISEIFPRCSNRKCDCLFQMWLDLGHIKTSHLPTNSSIVIQRVFWMKLIEATPCYTFGFLHNPVIQLPTKQTKYCDGWWNQHCQISSNISEILSSSRTVLCYERFSNYLLYV